MKRLVLLALAVIAVFLISYQLTRYQIVTAQSSFAPFTYSYSTAWRNFADPTKNKDERELVAQKSDGSTVRLTTFQNSREFVNRMFEMANGDRIEVSDLTKLKSTQHAAQATVSARISRRLSPTWGCSPRETDPRRTSLGPVTVLGHRGAKFQTAIHVSAEGPITITSTYALDLDCAEVERVEETLDSASGKVIKSLTRTPISIVLGEPEESVFGIPRDYPEVPPSTLNIAWGKYFGVEATPDMVQTWVNIMDRKYYAAQKP